MVLAEIPVQMLGDSPDGAVLVDKSVDVGPGN